MATPATTGGGTSTTSVRAAFVPVATWLPAWVAKDEGIFEAHGLDVTLTPIQNLSTLPPTLGQQFDIAATTATDLINAAASGLDVVGVSGEVIETSGNQATQLIVSKDSGITDIAQLKGKKIAVPTVGAAIYYGIQYWLKDAGVDPASVQFVEVAFPSMADQLAAGRVDAVGNIQPFVGQMLAAGNVSLGDTLLSIADPIIFPFWISQGEWARNNRGVITAWTDSLREAEKLIEKDDAKARGILAKYTKLPAEVASKIPLPEYNFDIAPEQLQVWIDALKSLNALDAEMDPAKLVVTGS